MSKRRRINDNKVAVNKDDEDDDDDDKYRYDHKNSIMKFSIKQEGDVLDNNNVKMDTIIDYDRHMPIQSTNPITIDDMNYNKSYDHNNNDDDTDQHQSIVLRQLQSIGSIFDIQTDTTSSSTTYRKKQSSLINTDSSSVLVILPGNIQLHNSNIKNLNTSNQKQQDNDQHKLKQETEFVTIGRMEGFHNIINDNNDNVPTPNNLTLTLGGNCCHKNSTTNHDMNQNHTSLVSSSNGNDDEVTEHIPSKEMSAVLATTTTQTPPSIVLHGRSIPTNTKFVLLHVTIPSSKTTSNKNKKQLLQQSNQPKVTCKGLYQNVIVFGEGKVIVPTSATITEKAETILSNTINHNADMHTATDNDDISLYNNCSNERNHINTTKNVDSNNTNIDTTIKIIKKDTTGTNTVTIPQENNLYNHDNDDDEVIILHPEPNDNDDDEVVILQPEPQQNKNDDTINKNTNKKQKLSTNKSLDDAEDNNVLPQNEIQQQSLTRSNQKRTRRHPQPESQHNTYESIEVKSECDDLLQKQDRIMMNKRKIPNTTASITSPLTPSPTRSVTKSKHTLSVLETESYIDKESSNKSNNKISNTKTIATSTQPTSTPPKSSHRMIKSSSMSIATPTTTPSSNRTSRRRRPISTNKIKKMNFDDDEFAFLGE